MRVALARNVLIVSQQPPQTLKEDSLFTTSVKYVDSSFIKLEDKPKFKIFMISETQSADLFKKGDAQPIQFLDIDPVNRDLLKGCKSNEIIEEQSTTFKDIRIKKAHKADTQPVTKENPVLSKKACLLYITSIKIGGEPTEIWCTSLPFILMTSSSQTCGGSATIFWDNYLHLDNRIPFAVPNQVSWSALAHALSLYFKYTTRTTWNLTPANLHYIGTKFFKNPNFDGTGFVGRTEFCTVKKDPEVTIWKWLYKIVMLIKSHLKRPWEAGSIVGFIDREEAEQILEMRGPGSFIVRFSDTKLGGVSITLNAGVCRKTRKIRIRSIDPLFESDLATLGLERRIENLKECINVLYYDENGTEFLTEKYKKFPVPTSDEMEQDAEAEGPSLGQKRPYEKSTLVMVMEELADTTLEDTPNPNNSMEGLGFSRNVADRGNLECSIVPDLRPQASGGQMSIDLISPTLDFGDAGNFYNFNFMTGGQWNDEDLFLKDPQIADELLACIQ